MVTTTVLLRIPQLKDAKQMTTSQGLSCGNALVKARQSVQINFCNVSNVFDENALITFNNYFYRYFGSEGALHEFCKKFVVEEKLAASYLQHLKDLDLKKRKREESRRQKS